MDASRGVFKPPCAMKVNAGGRLPPRFGGEAASTIDRACSPGGKA